MAVGKEVVKSRGTCCLVVLSFGDSSYIHIRVPNLSVKFLVQYTARRKCSTLSLPTALFTRGHYKAYLGNFSLHSELVPSAYCCCEVCDGAPPFPHPLIGLCIWAWAGGLVFDSDDIFHL